MVTENLDLDLTIKGKQDAKDVSKDFEQSRKSVEGLVKNLNQLEGILKKRTKEAQDFQMAMAGITGGRSLGQSAKLIAGGEINSVLANAAASGRRSDFKAQGGNILAGDVNALFAGIRSAIQAAKNQAIVEMTKIRQSVSPNDTLSLLRQKETAQTARVAYGQLTAASIPGGRVSASEVAALEQIRNRIREIEALERQEILNQKQLAKETQTRTREIEKQAQAQQKALNAAANRPAAQQAARENKLDMLFGDGGATLFKVQAGLLVNYAIMGQIFNLFQFGTRYVIEFDKALRDVQAITDTTNTNMEQLSQTFIDVSQNTRFSAVEIAKAAVTMGQAGLSAKQIEQSIGSVALLATASGSDIASSVDVVTSALTVFNLNASETAHVADVMTGALNLSKLTMDKLQLGIQYAGNTAAEAGTTLEELVAILGGVANAGIKSGSTIGTGIAQLFVELQNPTKKFNEELKRVGLNISDVDVKAKGMSNVLETLTQAGFGASSAFAAFDLRAARAFLAASRNIDTIKDFEQQISLSSSAAKANDTQMKSLENTMAKFRNTLGATIIQIAGPLKEALITALNLFSSILNTLNQIPYVLPIVGTAMLTWFGGAVLLRITNLYKGIMGLVAGTKELTVVWGAMQGMSAVGGSRLAAMGAATAATTREVTLLGRALQFVFMTPLGRIIGIVGTVVAGLIGWNAAMGDTSDELERVQTSIDNANGAFRDTQERIGSVDSELERLMDRYSTLSTNHDALQQEVVAMQEKFSGFSTEIRTDTITSVEDLISVLQKLKNELANLSLEQVKAVAFEEANKAIIKSNEFKDKFYQQYLDTSAGGYSAQGLKAFNPSDVILSRVSKQVDDMLKGNDLSTQNNDQLAKSNQVFQSGINEIEDEITRKTQEKNRLLRENSDADLDKLDKDIDNLRSGRDYLKGFKLATFATKTRNDMQAKNAVDELVAEKEAMKVAEGGKTYLQLQTDLKQAKADNNRAKVKAVEKELKAYRDQVFSDGNVSDIASRTGLSVQEVRNNISKGVGGQISDALAESSITYDQMTKSLGSGTKEYLGTITELQKLSIEELKRQIDLATRSAQNKIAQIDAVLGQINDRERGGLRGKYSDAEVSKLEDIKNDTETARIKERIKAITALMPKLKQLEDQQKAVYQRAQNSSDSDPKSGSKLQAAIQTQKDYNSAIDERIGYENELQELQAQADARDGVAKINGEIVANMTLAEQIQYVIDKYREQISIQESLGLNIQRNLVSVMDDARESLGDYFFEWVKGSKSAGDAFKSFALSVIEDMAKIAAKRAATGIFDYVLGAISGAISGGGTGVYDGAPAGAAPVIPVSSKPLKVGGFIRAKMGYAVPNRDSVPAMLEPGEFVFRKSAVQMLGLDNLRQMNAQGNAVTSRGANQMGDGYQGGQPAVTNVYVVAPDKQPTLTKNDVLVTIHEDMVRGGTSAKLVKRIVSGG